MKDVHLDRARDFWEDAKAQGFTAADIPMLVRLVDSQWKAIDAVRNAVQLPDVN